ncbi:MAG: carboxypeptidase-like regulatory domain-containing protein, partial [Candidatus Dormibacteria bacterium]
MQRMLAILLALLATTSSAFEPRHISNNELRTEKLGRIVDAATGAGIPDAKVIAVWGALAADASGSGYMCQLQRIATTDAAGNYVIPDVSHDLDLSRRGTGGLHTPMGIGYHSLDFDWHLMVFKPGYVRVGDMEEFKRKRDYGRAY